MLFEVLKKYEKYLIQALMALMAIVLVLGTLDLAWFVIKSVIESPYFLFDVNLLLDVFGMFMLVLIGIELLETIMKTYLTQGAPHYETVLSVAIIAIARKVIVLDLRPDGAVELVAGHGRDALVSMAWSGEGPFPQLEPPARPRAHV